MKDSKNIIIGCLAALLVATVAWSLISRQKGLAYVQSLEEQVETMREQEKLSAVDRRVSKQMEEIAYGQQAYSEERSREAIRQSEIAQAATLRSEAERKNALQAQAAAEVSAQEARESALMAENQRQIADGQRREAEYAKQVADTLNYISLGRTLGSQSYAVYQAGDKEIGTMLAYTSYLFTNDYHGDLYNPAVFQAVAQSAEGKQNWRVHMGTVSRVEFFPKLNRLLTVSTYGEIYVHDIHVTADAKIPSLTSKRLFANSQYCFRDAATVNSGKGYAISMTGHLVVVTPDHGTYQATVIPLENIEKPFNLQPMNDGKQLLIIAPKSIILLDVATDRVISTRRLDFTVISTGRRDYKPLLFDNKGRMHLISDPDHMTDEKVPVTGRVMAFASSKNVHMAVYGMSDGTIWLTDSHGKQHRLVGHRSQVTKMKMNGNLLYSSSMDGSLLFWKVGDSQIKPITLFETNSWLTDFNFDPKKDYIWTGEANGTLTEYLMSLSQLQERLRQRVKRNFTQQEWDYYVGRAIPYRKMIQEK